MKWEVEIGMILEEGIVGVENALHIQNVSNALVMGMLGMRVLVGKWKWNKIRSWK